MIYFLIIVISSLQSPSSANEHGAFYRVIDGITDKALQISILKCHRISEFSRQLPSKCTETANAIKSNPKLVSLFLSYKNLRVQSILHLFIKNRPAYSSEYAEAIGPYIHLYLDDHQDTLHCDTQNPIEPLLSYSNSNSIYEFYKYIQTCNDLLPDCPDEDDPTSDVVSSCNFLADEVKHKPEFISQFLRSPKLRSRLTYSQFKLENPSLEHLNAMYPYLHLYWTNYEDFNSRAINSQFYNNYSESIAYLRRLTRPETRNDIPGVPNFGAGINFAQCKGFYDFKCHEREFKVAAPPDILYLYSLVNIIKPKMFHTYPTLDDLIRYRGYYHLYLGGKLNENIAENFNNIFKGTKNKDKHYADNNKDITEEWYIFLRNYLIDKYFDGGSIHPKDAELALYLSQRYGLKVQCMEQTLNNKISKAVADVWFEPLFENDENISKLKHKLSFRCPDSFDESQFYLVRNCRLLVIQVRDSAFKSQFLQSPSLRSALTYNYFMQYSAPTLEHLDIMYYYAYLYVSSANFYYFSENIDKHIFRNWQSTKSYVKRIQNPETRSKMIKIAGMGALVVYLACFCKSPHYCDEIENVSILAGDWLYLASLTEIRNGVDRKVFSKIRNAVSLDSLSEFPGSYNLIKMGAVNDDFKSNMDNVFELQNWKSHLKEKLYFSFPVGVEDDFQKLIGIKFTNDDENNIWSGLLLQLSAVWNLPETTSGIFKIKLILKELYSRIIKKIEVFAFIKIELPDDRLLSLENGLNWTKAYVHNLISLNHNKIALSIAQDQILGVKRKF